MGRGRPLLKGGGGRGHPSKEALHFGNRAPRDCSISHCVLRRRLFLADLDRSRENENRELRPNHWRMRLSTSRHVHQHLRTTITPPPRSHRSWKITKEVKRVGGRKLSNGLRNSRPNQNFTLEKICEIVEKETTRPDSLHTVSSDLNS